MTTAISDNPATKPENQRWIDRHELLNIVPVGYSFIYVRMKQGKFPAPKRLGTAATAKNLWWLPDVYRWMEQQPTRYANEE